MANAVIMPKAGITVESCIIGEWFKKPGDAVALGDALFSYETDKTVFECESTAAGTLLEIFFDAGDEVPCLTNVCAIGEPGEDVSALRPAAVHNTDVSPAAATSAAPGFTPAARTAAEASGLSPRARRLAERAGIDAALAAPSGPKGRVLERDVRRLMAEGISETAPAATAPEVVPEGCRDVKFSGIRRSIAKAMYGSIQAMAQLTHHFSFDAGELQALRSRFKAMGGEYGGITLGDMILFAMSRTLNECPDLNANMLSDDKIRYFDHVNLGVAVDTPRGLMVPTIFKADTKSLRSISAELKDLAAKARSGSISPDLLKGGSFTVSNLGAFGVELFTPVINPPQTGILGVCAVTERPRKAKDGGLELYPAMGLSLTYDHRAIDGAPASRYMTLLCDKLTHFSEFLEAQNGNL